MTQEDDDFTADHAEAQSRDVGLHVADSLPTAFASLNLNKTPRQDKHHTKSASTSSMRRRGPATPTLTNLDQLTLHSPSSQIIGTPLPTDSTKFEYPFPESINNSDLSSCSASASSSTHASPACPILTPPLCSGSMFPLISTPSNGLPCPGLIQPGEISSSSSSSTASSTASSTSLAHLKVKPMIPPVPPSLVKKRPKWMSRRRSGYEGGAGCEGHDLNLTIEGVMRGDYGDGVIPPHSQRDDMGRNEY